MHAGERERRDHERARTVVQARRVPRGDRAARLEGGLERGQRLEGRVRTRALVLLDDGRALFSRDLDCDGLRLEAARRHRGHRLLVALEREAILVGARHASLLGGVLREVSHVGVVERVPQPVVNHPVHELRVARLDAGAHAEDVMGRVRHRLHPAGDDALLVARPDRLGGEHDRLEPRAAHLVDRDRRDRARKSRMDRRLACGRLPHPTLEHVAHDHFLDLPGVDGGAAHGLADHEGAELRRPERRETAEVLADRRADGADDDWSGDVAAHICSCTADD